jgi:hypothetical protein
MNFHPPTNVRAGHTLIEMIFTMSILVMVIMALLAANYLGMSQSQWVESKCGSSDSSRRLLNQFPVDVKSSKMWFLGNMTGTNFVINTNSSQGTAVELFLTTNGSQGIVYYYDLSNTNNNDGHLLRTVSTNWNPVVVASNLVNWLGNGYTFNIEDYTGSPATNGANNNSYKCIIHLDLQFCLFRFPLTAVGTNGLYDYYKIEFRATPHLPE